MRINMNSLISANKNRKAVVAAILAAALYGISAPFSKLLLNEISPTMMAALLYLGAGFGMLLFNSLNSLKHNQELEAKLTRKELPYILGMIILDIAAPILLMFGLTLTTAANAALLNNFEMVATSLIALLIFREAIGKRMWLAISLITASSFVLSIQDYSSFSFSIGSVFVLMACICWGFENNCTRMLSMKDPRKIVVLKGIFCGTGSLLISIFNHSISCSIPYLLFTLILGFFSYGLSIYFYILAQRDLGAARTSAYYAAAPFIGVILSWLIFKDRISGGYIAALIIMSTGTYFAVTDLQKHLHMHLHEQITHEHRHNHTDGHHTHLHEEGFIGEHSHEHTHEVILHSHVHTPDSHHNHNHKALAKQKDNS